MLDKLGSDDAAILASALYFKGDWTHKFDKKLTEEKDFTPDGAAAAKTPMMRQHFSGDKKISRLESADFDAVALTYGQKDLDAGKQPTMRIVLVRPKDSSVSARDWLSGQDTGAVPAWLDPHAFEHGVSGSVELPRLDIKQNFDLIPALKDMGISTAFEGSRPGKPGADFSRMVEKGGRQLRISKVSHDTVFKTDEAGSEAAAVTVVGLAGCAFIPAKKPLDFKLDRSFAFALQDVATGAVLFVGAVNKPNEDMKPAADSKPANGPKPR